MHDSAGMNRQLLMDCSLLMFSAGNHRHYSKVAIAGTAITGSAHMSAVYNAAQQYFCQ
jgi:hypothetical protein